MAFEIWMLDFSTISSNFVLFLFDDPGFRFVKSYRMAEWFSDITFTSHQTSAIHCMVDWLAS